jgi:hypothetical protein
LTDSVTLVSYLTDSVKPTSYLADSVKLIGHVFVGHGHAQIEPDGLGHVRAS